METRTKSKRAVIRPAWLAILSVVTGCGPSAASCWTGSFSFIQMADPQLGMFASNADVERETELFSAAIDCANRLRPAFVVICGDLTNATGDQAQIAAFKRIAGKLDASIPLRLVPGNHDVGNDPTPESLRAYRETFGQDWYAFSHGGCRFIVLNSTIIHRPARVADETRRQRTWLEAELRAARRDRPAHIIVFQHHPWFDHDPSEEDSYHNLPRDGRLAYLDMLADAGVTAVFAGHRHLNIEGRYRDMALIASGPVGKPLGRDPSGLRVVNVHRDHIEHTYHGLAALPQGVSQIAGNKGVLAMGDGCLAVTCLGSIR